MSTFNAALSGATAIAALTAAVFFLRFWTRSQDPLFLLFSTAFGADAVMRFVLSFSTHSAEDDPFYYLPRLITFGMIIVAIAFKNMRRNS